MKAFKLLIFGLILAVGTLFAIYGKVKPAPHHDFNFISIFVDEVAAVCNDSAISRVTIKPKDVIIEMDGTVVDYKIISRDTLKNDRLEDRVIGYQLELSDTTLAKDFPKEMEYLSVELDYLGTNPDVIGFIMKYPVMIRLANQPKVCN